MNYIASVTSQGQLNIPSVLQKKYSLKEKKVILEDTGNGITLKPIKSISEFFGILKTDKIIPFEMTRKRFEEALAKGEA